MSKLRVLDLFAGIGGFSLGLERTGGFETVAFCEIETYPQRVLRKHWPEVPIYDDVRELTAARLAADGIAVDVITGGFPCQDISVAGKQAGIGDGTRSGLWSECARLLGELRPRYAIFENVSNLLSGPSEKRGGWFSRILCDLAPIGYDAEWHDICASDVGLPHERSRAWIIAYPSEVWAKPCLQSLPPRQRAGQFGGGFGRTGVVRSNKPLLAGDYDGLPGWLDRHCACGNAVVPQIPELIGRAILEAERASMGAAA